MTHREALEQAVKDNPCDHTARLVLADWLNEQGDPKLEQESCDIRLAVLVDQMRTSQHDDALRYAYAQTCRGYGRKNRARMIEYLLEGDWSDLSHRKRDQVRKDIRHCAPSMLPSVDKRFQELLNEAIRRHQPGTTSVAEDAFWATWLAHYQEGDGRITRRTYISRGFVTTVMCDRNDWMKWGQWLYERHPIERVVMFGRPLFLSEDSWGNTLASDIYTHTPMQSNSATKRTVEDFLACEWPYVEFDLTFCTDMATTTTTSSSAERIHQEIQEFMRRRQPEVTRIFGDVSQAWQAVSQALVAVFPAMEAFARELPTLPATPELPELPEADNAEEDRS